MARQRVQQTGQTHSLSACEQLHAKLHDHLLLGMQSAKEDGGAVRGIIHALRSASQRFTLRALWWIFLISCERHVGELGNCIEQHFCKGGKMQAK